MSPKAVFSPRVKIPLLVITSDLTMEKSNFLILSCLNVEKINLFQSFSCHHRKLNFFLVIRRQFRGVQRIYWVNSLKCRFDKWFTLNLQSKNVAGG